MAKKCIHEIPKIKDSWWLRDAGLYQGYGVCIDRNGNIFDGSDWDEGSTDINFKKGVRPVLVVENHDFNVGDQFAFGNHKWTIIYIYGTNLDLCLAICNAIIDFHRFDKKSNDYESSEIKAIVDTDFRTNENKKLL